MTTIDKTPDRTAPAGRFGSPVAQARTSHVVCGIVALAMLFLLVQLLRRHAFWMDEAMLMTNIAEGTWGELLGPLPFYDQAAPLLYLLLLKALHAVFGLSESVVRLPAWVASATAVWILARRLPGLDPLERACAAAVLVASLTFAYLTMEMKPYNLEVLFGAVLLAWFQGPASSLRALLVRLGVLLTAIPAISTFPLLVLAVGAVEHLRGVRRPRDLIGRVLAGGWIYAVAGVGYIAYYTAHIKPAYQAALGNFGWLYESLGFARQTAYPLWLPGKIQSILTSHFDAFWSLVLVAIVVGLWRLRGRRTAYPAQAAMLAGTVLLLNILGVFPIMAGRFSVFLMPWIAVLAGVALAYVLSLFRDRGLQMLAGATAVCILMLPALLGVAFPAGQESRRAVAYLIAAREKADPLPVMVTMSGQPIYDVYLKALAAPGQDRCLAPGVPGYTNRCRALKAPGDGVFKGAATKWYMISYAAVIGAGMAPVGFPGDNPKAYADSYADWLVSQAPLGQPTLVFSSILTPKDTDGPAFQTKLGAVATIERVVAVDRMLTGGTGGQVDRVIRHRSPPQDTRRNN